MLKRSLHLSPHVAADPAAFRRLCVETVRDAVLFLQCAPAAFRRLCVETVFEIDLCQPICASRLQAAVC